MQTNVQMNCAELIKQRFCLFCKFYSKVLLLLLQSNILHFCFYNETCAFSNKLIIKRKN